MILQLVLLFQVGLGLGQEIGSLRIMNGTKADHRYFTYQAGLHVYFKGQMDGPNLCGATIIGELWLLTAAHCLQEQNATLSKVIVHVGSMDAPGGEGATTMTVPRMNTISHRDFNRETVENDIALIRLPRKLKLGKYIRPARLPRGPKKMYAGRKAIVSGWGLTAKQKPSSVLQSLKVNIISNSECQRQWNKQLNKTGERKEIYSSFICIDSTAGLPCRGDSGGPLVLDDRSRTVVGVVSHGYDRDCKIPLPDIFTRVSKYLWWIEFFTNIK